MNSEVVKEHYVNARSWKVTRRAKKLYTSLQALQSYVKIMKPIAVAIEFLQGDNDCFLGYVIPIITGIKKNL